MTRGKKKKMLMKAGKWATSHVVKRKRASATTLALRGLGVAAVAVPVGIWLGRKVMERMTADQSA